ncbi:hypothetical protein M2375_003476 [Comamonas sp. BIGb0152]|jgi:hypothetical protein|nr:hypothetical protein [Comamonas sp. BIGb0152]
MELPFLDGFWFMRVIIEQTLGSACVWQVLQFALHEGIYD